MKRASSVSLIETMPRNMSEQERLAIVQAELGCTPTQAKVLVAGASEFTCSELSAQLQIAEGTVRAHYHAFFDRTNCSGRNHATALVIAVLWKAAMFQNK